MKNEEQTFVTLDEWIGQLEEGVPINTIECSNEEGDEARLYGEVQTFGGVTLSLYNGLVYVVDIDEEVLHETSKI